MSEQIFLAEGNIQVSRSRLVIGNQTLSMAGIVSVRTTTTPRDARAAGIIALIGLLSLSRLIDLGPNVVLIVVGVGCLAGAAMLYFRQKRTHTLIVGTTGGADKEVLRSKDQQRIARVVSAVNEALIARG